MTVIQVVIPTVVKIMILDSWASASGGQGHQQSTFISLTITM